MFHSVLHQQEVQDVRGKHCKPSTGFLTVGPKEQITSIREWIHFTVMMQHKSNAWCISKSCFFLFGVVWGFFWCFYFSLPQIGFLSQCYFYIIRCNYSRELVFIQVGLLPSTEGIYEFKLTLCYYIIFYYLCYVEVVLYLTFFWFMQVSWSFKPRRTWTVQCNDVV